MGNLMKKIVAMLALLSLASCKENLVYKSIYSAGQVQCGITEAGTKCFRYISEGHDRDKRLIALDELGMPTSEKFSRLKMQHSFSEKTTRICGYAESNTACWDYKGERFMGVKIEPMGGPRSDFGVVTNGSKKAIDDPMGAYSHYPRKQRKIDGLVNCSYEENGQSVTCSTDQGAKAQWNLSQPIKKVMVSDVVCVYTNDLKISCDQIAFDNDQIAFLGTPFEVMSQPTLKNFASFRMENFLVLCATSESEELACHYVSKENNQSFPLDLSVLSGQKFVSAPGPLMIDSAFKLVKVSLSGREIKIDTLPETLASRKYQSLSVGQDSACMVEKDTGRLFCNQIDINFSGAWNFGRELETP